MRRELKLQLFHKFYEEPLDYTHLTLEKGDMYTYFLEEKYPYKLVDLTKDNFPIHLSDVPAGLVDEYREFLRVKLIKWGFAAEDDFDEQGNSTEMFIDYTLENYWDEISCNENMQQAHDKLMVVDEMIDAFEAVLKGLKHINENWRKIDLDFLECSDKYPFDESFDEFLDGALGNWFESVIAELLTTGPREEIDNEC